MRQTSLKLLFSRSTGKYPNRGYPKIFNDENVGEEAKKLHADGVEFLMDIIKNKTFKANAVVGIFPACSVGDDIEVYSADGADIYIEFGLKVLCS